jgi:hypothetical protein
LIFLDFILIINILSEVTDMKNNLERSFSLENKTPREPNTSSQGTVSGN